MAVILSTESIDSETTAQNSVENVLQSPDVASKSDGLSEKSSDTPTIITERTNLKTEQIVIVNKNSDDAGDTSDNDIQPEKILSNTEAELSQQPQTIESSENVEISEQKKITTQKSSDDNV